MASAVHKAFLVSRDSRDDYDIPLTSTTKTRNIHIQQIFDTLIPEKYRMIKNMQDYRMRSRAQKQRIPVDISCLIGGADLGRSRLVSMGHFRYMHKGWCFFSDLSFRIKLVMKFCFLILDHHAFVWSSSNLSNFRILILNQYVCAKNFSSLVENF